MKKGIAIAVLVSSLVFLTLSVALLAGLMPVVAVAIATTLGIGFGGVTAIGAVVAAVFTVSTIISGRELSVEKAVQQEDYTQENTTKHDRFEVSMHTSFRDMGSGNTKSGHQRSQSAPALCNNYTFSGNRKAAKSAQKQQMLEQGGLERRGSDMERWKDI
jgi:hypothetical protein